METKLLLAVWLLLHTAYCLPKDCGDCDSDACPELDCPSNMTAKDACSCCDVCLREEDEVCGGKHWSEGRCVEGYYCTADPDNDEDEPGRCNCMYPYRVCGSDGKDYVTYCQLRFSSWRNKKMGGDKIHRVHKGFCKFAPIISIPPTDVRNTTGNTVFMSCEVKSNPSSQIVWKFKKDEEDEGVDLPADYDNIFCSFRGGPDTNKVTGWVLIEGLQKTNAGIYQCFAANEFGNDTSTAYLEVLEEELCIDMRVWGGLLLVLVTVVVVEGRKALGKCPPCKLDQCPDIRGKCLGDVLKDPCDCCEECAKTEGETCGGKRHKLGTCMEGLHCETKRGRKKGVCVCNVEGKVCGTDGVTYNSLCELDLNKLVGFREGWSLEKRHDGPCYSAPEIVTPPQHLVNASGAQVYLMCEVTGIPSPRMLWRKLEKGPDGMVKVTEIPGDKQNLAIQVRGGPEKHQVTSWILIYPVYEEDAGEYECYAENTEGWVTARGSLTVTHGEIIQDADFDDDDEYDDDEDFEDEDNEEEEEEEEEEEDDDEDDLTQEELDLMEEREDDA
ncbi:PREDICTED: uncharacterized protein LOC109463154 [Branchiostoma belcheri]|uniref:Uncharacterized protein LOC109463154 n=1 Tax=Branchiostoma belcheri TaxID=7741 RepID=A0A6P4XY87_BRABE|nr:PREDICTED: uncharacterized protein LOC109463154 [Branchiostoma belcheri]